MAYQEVMQELKLLMADTIRGVHTMIPGKVVTFDPDKCEADILPCGKFKKPDGEFMDFPRINGVPVYFPQGAGQTATIVYPVKAGDECMLIFSEQALDTWRTGAASDTDLRFDLTNAAAIVGLFSRVNPLVKEACDDNALIIEKDGERVRLKKGETYIRDTAGQSITMTPAQTTMIVNNLVVQSSGNVTIAAGGNVAITGARIDLN
jgi:hypothetical protein